MTSHYNSAKNTAHDEIDLNRLFVILFDSRWFILISTFILFTFGYLYAASTTPIYKADALIQIEKEKGAESIFDMSDHSLFAQEQSSSEIEILKSRMVLGKTVNNLNLTTVVAANYFPFLGKRWAELSKTKISASVGLFAVPFSHANDPFILKVTKVNPYHFELLNIKNEMILNGKVGELISHKGYRILVDDINAKLGDSFTLAKRSELDAIKWIKSHLKIVEQGVKSGIFLITFQSSDSFLNQALLNDITKNYFIQNINRNVAEAEQSLIFIEENLPKVKDNLSLSEEKLNRYLQKNASVDLTLETKSTLEIMRKIESQIKDLEFKENEISKRYTAAHPIYSVIVEDKENLLKEKKIIDKQIQKMPTTQREVLRLTRDVEVNQQIYLQLLNKVQELQIIKASTLGNIRILDPAMSDTIPIQPNSIIIIVLYTLIGFVLSAIFVIFRGFYFKGIEDPYDIESIGLPVYAHIPLSKIQLTILKKRKKKIASSINQQLLAEVDPTDPTIEALRMLRTNLHHLMKNSKNNILMISSATAGVGKSFISANLATIFAHVGLKVLVIDGDMRKGHLQSSFDLPWQCGLSDYLSGSASFYEVIKFTSITNLHIVTRGFIPKNPSELLIRSQLTEFLASASQRYDLVLIDSPPILPITDASILGAHAGISLLVGRFGMSKLDEINISVQRFAWAGVNVNGFIFNAIEPKIGQLSSYTYSYK